MLKPQQIKQYLFRSTSAANLGLFRFLFGWVLFWEFGRNWWVEGYGAFRFIDPAVHFKYPFFHWITELPEPAMYFVFYAGTVASVMLSLGLLYRISTVFLFFSYSYLFLLDVSYYNNHYYFYCLILFLMIFTHTNRAFSVDRFLFRLPDTLPRWQLMLFRFQVIIVYFFGGISKIFNTDWLRNISGSSLLAGVLQARNIEVSEGTFKYMTYVYTYGGLLFDLLIGPILLTRRLFFIGAAAVVFFNISNFLSLDIGSFPLAMIGTLSLFYPTDQLHKLSSYFNKVIDRIIGRLASNSIEPQPTTKQQRTITWVLAVWMSIHLLMPFKHLLIEGNVYWSEEGKLFTWNMMSGTQDVVVGKFYALIVDPNTGELIDQVDIDIDRFLNYKQKRTLGKRPYVIPQLMDFLEEGSLQEEGLTPDEVEVYGEVWRSRNNRPLKFIVDPNVDLTTLEYEAFEHNSWILLYAEEGL